MIKKLSNNRGVQESSTLTGIRELLREYRNKTNEIIDFLEAKEEVDKTWLKEIILKDKGIGEPNYEEASKGECKQHSCEYYKCRCILDPNTGYCISKSWHVCNHYNPPESNGECGCCLNKHLDRGYSADGVCGKCKHDMNPPEHEEDNWTIKLHMLSHQIKEGVKKWVDVENYIRDNFVSKEKIKRVASGTETRFSNKTVSMAIEHLLESLGLGD